MEAAVKERPIPTGEGLTFEKVWAMFQESDRRMQETERVIQEKSAKTERFLKKIGKQMGYLNNRFGELAEHLVAPGIAKRFNELGHHFDGIAPGGYKISDSTGKVIAEVDLLLENGDCIMAVEVKVRPKQKDIERHIKRLEILREHRSNKHDSRKIYGAIAGAIFGTAEKKEAIDAGFFVLEQSGDTMKMDIPDGFVPRAY